MSVKVVIAAMAFVFGVLTMTGVHEYQWFRPIPPPVYGVASPPAFNELEQARETKNGWKLLTNAYRDSLKVHPQINKLLHRFGLQLGTIVEKEKL